MPATYDAKHLTAVQRVKMHDFDPDVTTVVAVEWMPIGEFRRFLAKFMRTIGTSATTFDIAAATSVAGANATQVKAHAVGSEPDALEDQLVLEVNIHQIREVLAGATHWSARLSFATATDEGAVVTIEANPFYERSGLTADIVA